MISKRIQYIIDIIPQFEILADIGTDHGYIPVNLIKTEKAKKIIASDISKLSLQKAIDYISLNKLQDKIETRLGSGIEILETDEVDAVVIAGMGGILISRILDDSYNSKFVNKTPNLILQPVQQPRDLRYYLYENEFTITDEYIMEDANKIYQIIMANKSDKKDENYLSLSKNKDVYMEFGIINIRKKSDLLFKIIKNRIEKTENLISKLEKKSVNRDKIDEISNELEQMKEIFYETWSID